MSGTSQSAPVPRRVIHKTAKDTGLVERPTLLPHFGFHALDDRQVFLVSETANTLLHGTIYPDLLPLLDGRRTYAEIVSGIEAGHREPSIRKALVALVSKGYVVSGEHGLKNGVAAFWTSLGASPRFAEERLAASRVAVYGDTGGFAQRLASLNAALTDDASAATLSVIVCDDYLDERHAETNRRHIASGKPWMLVRSIGMQPLFGPVFRPGEHGPCWACLTYRLSGNQEIHNFLRNATDGDISLVPKAAAPASLDVVLGLAATELVKWLVLGKAAPIHEQAVSFDNFEFSLARHTVMRRPQCSVCGDESLYRSDRQLVPVRLTSSPKSLRNSGGVRSVTPESTLARYRNLVDPIAGVVTWLRRMTSDSDPWLNVHWAGSNLALKNRALNVLRLSLRTKSAGKGSTPSQSEASALCEALERYCGAYHGDEIRFRRRYIDFSVDGGSEAIHPNSVQLFSEAQLDDADRINASGHPYNVVPPRLDPDAEMDWSPVWSLTGDCPRYLPTSLLYYGKSTDNRGVKDFVADSNGCAAGNTLEEAILQGFFELVERDAFAVWWYNQLRMPEVDLESFDDAYLAKARDYYRGLNRDLWVLDVTGDFGIPAFVALSRRTDGKAEDIVYGAGAHMDPHIGVLRAVCELNQFLNWVQGTGPGGAGYQVDDPQCLTWWRNATIENQPYLVPATDMLARRGSSYPPPPTAERDDLREDLERCIALVEAKGMEFLVLDQTRPDIGMPVARVIVPGMRHYWARLAPGRLFDVPVEMGWRECRISEAEINMAPVIG